MRISVITRMAAGLGVVVASGLVSMMIIAIGLREVRTTVEDLGTVEVPTTSSAYEMEINVNGFGLSVLKYLNSASPRYRAWATEDDRDLTEFLTQYLSLVDTPEEQQLGERLHRLLTTFRALGRLLMEDRDRQEAFFLIMSRAFETIDQTIDRSLQPKVAATKMADLVKRTVVGDLEADAAEVGLWLANYRRVQKSAYKRKIFEEEMEFRDTLAGFRSLDLSDEEARLGKHLAADFEEGMKALREIVRVEDSIDEGVLRFIALREELDRLLDDEVQPAAIRALAEPRMRAELASESVLRSTRFLIPLFLLLALTTGFILVRSIRRPVRMLNEGAEAVRRGDLAHRIAVSGRDELGDLAFAFNRMVEELGATTVSKTSLETSEARLKETVAALRNEIGERVVAEQERVRLEAALRRSEIMSKMGLLVAGVAHEVRNPLFGISSTVDALEARCEQSGVRETVREHLTVLRSEVERLSGLMRELLEFGTPADVDLRPRSLGGVIGEAVELCAPLALRLGVELRCQPQDGSIFVSMNHDGLLRAFRNLIENAVQHSPRGQAVRVEGAEAVCDGGRSAEFRVSDSGPGFAAEDLPHVFEPFFSRRRGGTGLGLAIVRRVVDEHHGTIHVETGSEAGAVIVVRLPACPPDGVLVAEGGGSPQPPSRTT